jgi:hypothetical protein
LSNIEALTEKEMLRAAFRPIPRNQNLNTKNYIPSASDYFERTEIRELEEV